MLYKTLNVEIESELMTITVNRPDKLNALSEEVLSELKTVLLEIKSQSGFSVKGIILTGSGEKAFIAGADIKGMNDMSVDEGESFGGLGQEVAHLLQTVPVPVIACVNGYALGGGCEMAMGCDYIFATSNAVFGQPEVNLGLIPGFGGCVRLFRYVGPGRAKELIYTGRNIKVEEAKEIGLVNKVFSTKDEMIVAARKSLEMIKTKSPFAVSVCKEVLYACDGADIKTGMKAERAAFRKVFGSEDKKEGVAAFVEKRQASFTGN